MKRLPESPAVHTSEQAELITQLFPEVSDHLSQFISQNVNLMNIPAKAAKGKKMTDHSSAVPRMAAPVVNAKQENQAAASEIPYAHSIEPFGVFKISKNSAFQRIVPVESRNRAVERDATTLK